MPRATLARQHRQRGHPPGRDLDRVQRGERGDERVVVGEGVHRRAQLEPLGALAERVQRHVVAAVGQAVEVLEDVAVPAADAGVLGHVDDPQPPLGRCAPHDRSKKPDQRSQNRRWDSSSRSPWVVPRVTDSWWTSRAIGK